MDASTVGMSARALAGALEPVAGQVYFSPECHAGYQALGFDPSLRRAGQVELPDGPAYFCSRGSVLGQVPGEVVAAAFAVFNPAAVVPSVRHGWSLTDAATICAARTVGATAQLRRLLGDRPDGLERVLSLLQRAGAGLRPEGRPLYAGLLALELPGDPLGDMWRFADRLREYRGDAHTAAWTSAGFDAAEIGLLTECYWGLPTRSYVRTRAWTDADLDAAEDRLEDRGLLDKGTLTATGRREREAVEVATDEQCRPIVAALSDDLGELTSILRSWGGTIRAGGGYLPSGPHDLADAAAR
jgi:hypothetical protein